MSIAAEGFHTVGSPCGFSSIPTSPTGSTPSFIQSFPQCPFENPTLLFASCRIILPLPIAGWLLCWETYTTLLQLQIRYRFFFFSKSVSIFISVGPSYFSSSPSLRLSSYHPFPSSGKFYRFRGACTHTHLFLPDIRHLISSFTYRTVCAPSVAFVRPQEPNNLPPEGREILLPTTPIGSTPLTFFAPRRTTGDTILHKQSPPLANKK